VDAPAPWRTSEPGTFAHDTLRVRVPEILASTRARLPPHPPDVAAALDELAHELVGGRLRPRWDAAAAPHVGHSWLDLPWFFAESFFYRRLLEATGYFGQGALADVDPFAAAKNDEWRPDEAPRRCADALDAAPAGIADRLRALLHASLWGNRADLSYNVARHLGSHSGDADSDLLVDDAAAVSAFVLARPRRHVVLIADNAGTELLMDLALADHLLATAGVERVSIHVKTHPTFVSDAITADIDAGLVALRGGRPAAAALAERVRAWRAQNRLRVDTHWFYTSDLFYPALPPELHTTLAAADLVVLKGDANYRRLCSDAPWPPETPFTEVVAHFPTSLVALRTFKAEVVVGLPPGAAAHAATRDARWMVSGRFAVVQARLR